MFKKIKKNWIKFILARSKIKLLEKKVKFLIEMNYSFYESKIWLLEKRVEYLTESKETFHLPEKEYLEKRIKLLRELEKLSMITKFTTTSTN